MGVRIKRMLPCPECGFRRLIDADEHTKTETIAEVKMPQDWIPDFFQKCPQCKKQIGIRKVS